MEAMLFVYFANILPQISSAFTAVIIGLIFGVCAFAFIGWILVSDREMKKETYKKFLKLLTIPLIVLSIVNPLIPNRDTIYLMAGAYVGQQVLTSDIAKDTYEIIGLEVKNILKDKKEEIQGQIKEGVK